MTYLESTPADGLEALAPRIEGESHKGPARTVQLPVLAAQPLIERAGVKRLIPLLRVRLGFPREVFERAAWPLIEGFAEFVQLLPVPDSRRYGDPGGQLYRGLVTALHALERRRGQILPRGAAPEIIGAQAHRWSYAVFAAALLRDLPELCTRLCVWLNPEGPLAERWDPAVGSMFACGATCYRIEMLAPSLPRGADYSTLSVRLFERAVPPAIQAWLGDDAALLSELRLTLLGRAGPTSVIVKLIARTESGPVQIPHSPALDQGVVNAPTKVPNADVTSLAPHAVEPEFLDDVKTEGTQLARDFMAWVHQEIGTGTLSVNQPGSLVHGVDEGLLLVSPHIFREFVKSRGASNDQPVLAERSHDSARNIQREVLRAGWHLRADLGVNILCYEWKHAKHATLRINGIVIRKPDRFIVPLPAVNPALTRVIDSTGSTP